MIEYIVSIWFWAVGWRIGPPPCNGEYLVQCLDGSLRVAEFVRGNPDPDGGWSVIGPIACWRHIRRPIPALSPFARDDDQPSPVAEHPMEALAVMCLCPVIAVGIVFGLALLISRLGG